jgi:hypothetical protein
MKNKRSRREHTETSRANMTADRIADYAARGRKHEHLEDQMLVLEWVLAVREMAEDVRDYKRKAVEDDLKSELQMRGMEPPLELVRDELDRYCAKFNRAIEEMRFNDPEAFAERSRRAEAYLDAFRSDDDKLKN